MILGMENRGCIHTDANNVFVIGDPRSGLTRGYTLSRILDVLEKGESVIVHDPKKEIYKCISPLGVIYGYHQEIVNSVEDFDAAVAGKEKSIIYVQCGCDEKAATAVIQHCYITMYQYAHSTVNHMSAVHVTMLLEEFDMLDKIEDLYGYMVYGADRNIGTVISTHSISNMIHKYGKTESVGILSHCQADISLRVHDINDATFLSQMFNEKKLFGEKAQKSLDDLCRSTFLPEQFYMNKEGNAIVASPEFIGMLKIMFFTEHPVYKRHMTHSA